MPDELPSRKEEAPSPEGWAWQALVSEPDAVVYLLDADLRVLYCNGGRPARESGWPPERLVGKTIDELMVELGADPRYADETKKIVERLRVKDGAISLRRIWEGKQWITTYRRIQAETERFLVVTRRVIGPVPERMHGEAVVEADWMELGPLDVLTPRELEVLCLIGQGLATKDIATLLHRSPHTIEVHRRSIGRKLGDTNRVGLARVAMEAGLTLGDADRQRMSRRGPTPT
jgi:DNA-binding CsgD family transcriptional regulator